MPTKKETPRIYKSCIHTSAGPVEIRADSFLPDRQERWTRAQLEAELPWLIFTGPGWYIKQGVREGVAYKDMTLLIPRPADDPAVPQIFLVCMWSHHEALDAFDWINNAPVQVDDR